MNGERGGGGARRPPAASGPQAERALPPPVGTRPAGGGARTPRPRGRSGLLAPHCVSGGRPARPHLALPPRPAARPALGRALPGAAGLGGAGERSPAAGCPRRRAASPRALPGSSGRTQRGRVALLPVSVLKSKLAAPGITQLPFCFGFVSTLRLIVLPPAWTLTPFPSPSLNALPPGSQSFVLDWLPALATVSGQLGCPAVYHPFTSLCGIWK